MVGVVGWLTSHDIRQHIFRTWYCFCARRSIMVTVSLGTGSFPSSKKKISKIPKGAPAFSKKHVVFVFAEFGTRITRTHTSNNQKRVKRDKHQDTKLTWFCWNGIPTGEGFCPKKHLEISVIHCIPYLRSGLQKKGHRFTGTLRGSMWKEISNPTVNWIGPTVKSSYDRFVYAPEAEHGNWEYNNIETPAPNWTGKSSAGWTNNAEFDPMILVN